MWKMATNGKSITENLNATPVVDEKLWDNELKTLSKLALVILGEIKALESVNRIKLQNSIDLLSEVRNFEINLIKLALLHSGGSQQRAAQLLGISESTLSWKMKRYKITRLPSLKNSNFSN
jgi:transcriptional regulator with PAS, ATPase and Fis domain